jgi:hypothetical protein
MRMVYSSLLLSASAVAWAQCGHIRLQPSSDYAWLVASGSPAYQLTKNGAPIGALRSPQSFLLHGEGDGSPLEAVGVALEAGRFGTAVTVQSGGRLSFAREGALDLKEGAVEMWVAARLDGSDPVYAQRDHTLFAYRAANGDELRIVQSRTIGVLYGGGNVNKQWQSAYGSQAATREWMAGEWHHVVFTWSAAGNFMRLYVDGALAADTNEKHYWPPEASGDRFTMGTDQYALDEVRIFSRPLEAAEIRALAARNEPPAQYEAWLPVAGLSVGDTVAIEVEGCPAVRFAYDGIPLYDAAPLSTLLPPETTQLDFAVKTRAAADCRYSVNQAAEWDSMTPFSSGQGSTEHQTTLMGLSPDTLTVNQVRIRCSSAPGYEMVQRYRSIPRVNPRFPRTGNLWGTGQLRPKGLEHAARIDLHLGAGFTPSEISRLRRLNPDILILTSINTVENSGLPEDYYLHDTTGSRIEVWPGTYRLNLTKPHVAEYQARWAYQHILDSGLMVDGCFFDNFFTTQSWLRADIHGRAVQLDADEDGKPDDPAWLDREWKAGVYHELESWRALMPHALASGHLPRPPAAEFSRIFNGDSIGFMTADAIEGRLAFDSLWSAYHDWWRIGREPALVMVESSPHDQIAYGYDYSPLQKIPPTTLEFARTYYPFVRFGLAFTLMNDGFFAHEFGDTWHGNDWWYDELDFDLGYSQGAARRVQVEGFSQTDWLENGSFEQPLEGTWVLTVSGASGAAASLSRDAETAAEGRASAKILVTNSGQGTDWHVDFNQRNRRLKAGVGYDLEFWAKADKPRQITLSTQKGSPDWRNYGLSKRIDIGVEWRRYTAVFEAKETVEDSRVQFFLGAAAGAVWIDAVRLVEHPPEVWRRDFDKGVALLNGTRQPRTVVLEDGLRRLTGGQAAMHEYIVDDASTAFRAGAEWKPAAYDSGEWKSAGPFFHDWAAGCRRNDGQSGEAEFDLELRADGVYTVAAWWPAAPTAKDWSRRVVHEVVAEGRVLASKAFDQTSGGDEWHEIATVELTKAARPVVRVRNEGNGAAIADAIHVRSAARFNDGSPAAVLTLEPMDGIVLRK